MSVQPAAMWKRVVASILDFCTVFFGGGWVIAKLSDETTPDGFELYGQAAFILFIVIVIYFYTGRRMLGGTLWDRIFRIGRPQPY